MNCQHLNWSAKGAYCNDCGITDYEIQCGQTRQLSTPTLKPQRESVSALVAEVDDLRTRLAALESKQGEVTRVGYDDPPLGGPGSVSQSMFQEEAERMLAAVQCDHIGEHHGDKCNGGRIQAPNAQFTQECPKCKGSGVKSETGTHEGTGKN